MKVRLLITFKFFLICCFAVLAEVSTVKDSNNNYTSHIFMGREYPHNEIWVKYGNDPNKIPLNENGDLNGDGKPALAVNPLTGYPEVAWSKFDGIDYEIAYSHFDGSTWSTPELITDNDINEFDPFIAFSGDGTVKITWWTDEPIQQVYYKLRKYSGDWSITIRVSDFLQKSQYPSIATLNNLSYVVYENPASPNVKNIVMGGIIDDPDPIPQLLSRITIASSDFAPNTLSTPHVLDGHVWVDWIYDENFLCWSEKIGEEWTPQRYEAYSGLDDIPRARLYIKIKVLNDQ